MKRLRVALAFSLGVVLVAGCTPTSTTADAPTTTATGVADEGTPRDGGKIGFALAAETNTWNPYQGQWTGSGYIVANAIFDPLAAVDPDGAVRPFLAESFAHNADFTEWTIRLRPDIAFHNGEKLDAAAVKANMEFGRKAGLTSQVFATIASVETQGDRAVVVRMSAPWSTFPLTLVGQPGYMAAPAMLADTKNGGSNPIGTGPFAFVDWTQGASLKVRKNTAYWRPGLPHLNNIEFIVQADAATRAKALSTGDVDVYEVTTAAGLIEAQDAATNGRAQLFTTKGNESDETIIALNTTKPPFDDPLARQAIAMGLDQDLLAETAFEGALPAARGPFEEGSPYYLSPADAGYPPYDLEKAKDLARQYEAKHGEPIRFTALIPPDPGYASIAQTLQSQAKSAGLEVNLQTIDTAALIPTVLGGNYQASGFLLFSTPTLDRAYPFIATTPGPGLSLNFTRMEDPEIVAAMNEARSTDDRAKQIEAYKRVQRRFAQDLDKIFLVHNTTGLAYSDALKGLRATTFPGTEVRAYAGMNIETTFTASAWLDDQGS